MILGVDVCQNTVMGWRVIGFLVLIVRILVPILIIVTSVVPLFNALLKGTADETVKSWKTIGKKLAAGIIVFLIPSLVASAVDLFAKAAESDDLYICTSCFEEPGGEECQYNINLYKQLENEDITKFKEESIEGQVNTSEMDEGTMGDNSDNNGGSSSGVTGTNSATVESLLSQAKQITDYARNNNFDYGDAPLNPAINHDAKLVSCDRCVGWFLYNVGFTDQPYRSGLALGALQDYCDSHGFKKITDVSQVQAGDIIFVNPNSSGNPGHVYLLGNNLGNGVWERYDCGSVYRIRLTNQYSSYSSQPFHEAIGNFLYAYRMPNA